MRLFEHSIWAFGGNYSAIGRVISCFEKLLPNIPRRRTTVSFNIHQFIWALLRNKHWVCVLVQLTFLQHVWRSTTHCRMAQCRETILKMEEWSINSTVVRGSISMALLSFIVIKECGMALHQAVNQTVSISERELSTTNHLFKSTTITKLYYYLFNNLGRILSR